MEILETNDKRYAPFLLASSYSKLVDFVGNYSKNGILYWQFSPKDKAEDLLHMFKIKKEPYLPSWDLFDAIETFWQEVYLTKKRSNEGINHDRNSR